MMRIRNLAARPLLVRLAALVLLAAIATAPLSAALDAANAIDAARDRLGRARALAARPPVTPPLVAADGDTLLAAFRDRLDALAAGRAIVIDAATLEPDAARPDLPRLRVWLRGTSAGLHGLLHALDGEAPRLVVEEADLSVARPADGEIGRPTILNLVVMARGVIAPPPGRKRP
ncbi:hypothetical protein MKK88_04565 [Methylobacterium sp. E-005]|uniref:hypothetical protein n=1 Tax=Methylobacterium sp. E-005 TaxID=2836549 RepID=UPI001FB91D64|nr:hypothetical protein [Methylobacterium sp. E-005]MCJ2085269.1 hypothetical protein [Methylobacterium sp. E-005]